ncbi:hypothetical protein GCM10008944_26480 [Cytobacillus oceanisediminis]
MMLTCHWSARRIQRYLDADPSEQLTSEEVQRLEQHLAVCDRCAQVVREGAGLKAALAGLATRRAPDPARVARLRLRARRIAEGELG